MRPGVPLRAYVLLSIALLIAMTFAVAGEPTPPWMENVISGDRKVYLIPKGAKREVIGSQVIVEGTDEYVARRIYEFEQYMKERLDKLQKAQEELTKQVQELRSIIGKLETEGAHSAAGIDTKSE